MGPVFPVGLWEGSQMQSYLFLREKNDFWAKIPKKTDFGVFWPMRTWGVSTCKFRNFWRKLVLIEAYNTLWWAKGVPKQVYATQGHVLETYFSMYGLYSTYAG